MYYATPFSSPGIIDGKLVNSSDETYSDGLKLPFTGGTGMGYYGNGFSQTSNNSLNVDVILDQKMDFLTKGLSFKVKDLITARLQLIKSVLVGLLLHTLLY